MNSTDTDRRAIIDAEHVRLLAIFHFVSAALSFVGVIFSSLYFFLFQVDSPNDPENSVFSFPVLGTTVAHTRIIPNFDLGGVLGVAGVTRANAQGDLTRSALNIHMEGDRFSASGGEVIDVITLPDTF